MARGWQVALTGGRWQVALTGGRWHSYKDVTLASGAEKTKELVLPSPMQNCYSQKGESWIK